MITPGFACKDAGQAFEVVPVDHVKASLEVFSVDRSYPCLHAEKMSPSPSSKVLASQLPVVAESTVNIVIEQHFGFLGSGAVLSRS